MIKQNLYSFPIFLVIFIFIIISSRALFLTENIYNIDEAEYSVYAFSWDKGLLPAKDLIGSTKPPGIIIIYLLLFKIFGESLISLRIGTLIFLFLILIGIREIGKKLFDLETAFFSAISFPIFFSSTFQSSYEMMAFNSEIPQIVFIIWGIYFITLSITKQKNQYLILSGIFFAFSFLIRQSSIFQFLGILIWLLLFFKKFFPIIITSFGFIFGLSFLILFYIYNNAIDGLFINTIIYPIFYSKNVNFFDIVYNCLYKWSRFFEAYPFIFLILIFHVEKLFKRRIVITKYEGLILIWLISSIFSVWLGNRFYGHYFIQIFPAFSFIIGLEISSCLKLKNNFILYLVISSLLFTILAENLKVLNVTLSKTRMNEDSLGSFLTEEGKYISLEEALGNFIKKNSLKDDKIFVWGYAPQIYWYSKRVPAVRDFLCQLTTGFYPGASFLGTPFLKDGEEKLIEELSKNNPKFIIDISKRNYFGFDFKLSNFNKLYNFISKEYIICKEIKNIIIYKGKSYENSCM